MARLLILSGEHQGAALELRPGCLTLGRAEDNDFALADPAISNRHCEVEFDEAGVRVRDLGSTNGTFVEGQPVREAELNDGQTLTLGDIEMRLALAPEEARPSALHLEAAPQLPTLPDGRPACVQHPQVAAVFVCSDCAKTFCAGCVRGLHLVGGQTRHFCPMCSSPCRTLPGAQLPARKVKRGLWQTMKLGFAWKHPKL